MFQRRSASSCVVDVLCLIVFCYIDLCFSGVLPVSSVVDVLYLFLRRSEGGCGRQHGHVPVPGGCPTGGHQQLTSADRETTR